MGSLLNRVFFVVVIISIFGSCAIKNSVESRPAIATIKSKKLKLNSTAFLKTTTFYTSLNLYNVGNVVADIKINSTKICFDNRCFKKSDFNHLFLSSFYPDDILQNIINSKPIYNALNINRYNNGFTQFLKSKDVDIVYKVDNNRVYFKDKKNSILIKIRILSQPKGNK
jgi:hypothetical protein